MATVRAESLYHVFGRRAEQTARALAAGHAPEEANRHGSAVAVVDASFEVNEGETFVLSGLSGSGKSTLIRLLNGLLTPTLGQIFVNGTALTGLTGAKLRRARQRTTSMVFARPALLGHRTVLQNAGYGLQAPEMTRAQRDEAAAAALEFVGLHGHENMLPHQLSASLRQRVSLARALATDTGVLLMDEPFTALDPLQRRELQDLLRRVRRLGKTIILGTPDLGEAMCLADRIALLHEGRIVQVGTPEALLHRPANDLVAAVVTQVDRATVLTAGSVMEPPVASVPVSARPADALHAMQQHQRGEVFVLSDDRELLGVLTEAGLAEAARAGLIQLGHALSTEVTAVSPQTPVRDLLTLASRSRHPLAVVADDRRLLGVIPHTALLGALSSPGDPDPLVRPTGTAAGRPQATPERAGALDA